MINAHREIYLFLQGKSEKGLEIISNIFYKQLFSTSYRYLTNYDAPEDIFMDFMTKVFEKRSFLLDIFYKNDEGLPQYIRTMAKNFLKDRLRKKMSEIQVEFVNDYKDVPRNSKNIIEEEEIIKLEALSLKKYLDKKLREEEFLILCYMVAKNRKEFEEVYFKGIKKNTIYKRVQRMKEKLQHILSTYDFDTVEYYFDFILPLICKRGEKNG